MRNIKLLTNNKFLNIKEVEDTEHFVKGFQFAERKGVDSIAFICYNKDSEEILLNLEYKPPVDEFILGAFGGSIDKDKSLEEIVQDEVREEAGFDVDKEAISYVGKVLVSTQMNQYCHLYLVFVKKEDQKERQPENKVEALASTKWIDSWTSKELVKLQDWKPITIISLAEYKGII